MKRASRFMISVMVSAWMMVSMAHADEVVLTSGERFTSDKIWEEKGKIRFNMHGLVVSVEKSDVASIIRSDGSTRLPQNLAHNKRPPSKGRLQPSPAPRSPKVAPTPSERSTPQPDPPSISKSKPNQKVKGIGFKGIAWHMRPKDMPGLSKIGTEEVYGGIDQYWQPDGPLSLGDALLDGLVFGFWQDRLYSIMMWVDGKPGYKRLKQVIFKRYGQGVVSKNQKDRYVWVEDRTTDRLLEFDTKRNIGIFWMRSRDIDALIKQRYPESTTTRKSGGLDSRS